MTFKRNFFGLAALWAFIWSLPAWTHHSHGNYLRTDWVFLEGTVKELHWMNPHSWLYLEVMGDDGDPIIWALEGASVTTLRRGGWTQDSLEVGDDISVRCHRLKDGSRGCLLGFITTDSGIEKEFD